MMKKIKGILSFLFDLLSFPVFTDWISRVFFERGAESVLILTYHSVGVHPVARPDLTIHPAVFEKQLAYLQKHYHSISLDVLAQAITEGFHVLPKKNGRRFVAISFDDGYEDNYTVAFPLLVRYQIPATFNITTGFIEHTRAMSAECQDAMFPEQSTMSWKQIEEMAQNPLCHFGAHTVTHPRMSQVDLEQARQEMMESKSALEKRLHRPIHTFAFPFGSKKDFNEGLVELAKQSGFTCVLSTVPGMNTVQSSRSYLKRIDPTTTIYRFKARLSMGYTLVRNLRSRFE
ncbi:MAG: polysaccharide deacetylase family protein [Candidatus Uhrbacteria bacterium]|nr:polysaccharide deacetylase family protein [Candidatus Uhrbacteria bacterium]